MYRKDSVPPTCSSHSRVHPQGGALQRIATSRYWKRLWAISQIYICSSHGYGSLKTRTYVNYSAEELFFSLNDVNGSNRKWCLALKYVILLPFIINTQYYLLLSGYI